MSDKTVLLIDNNPEDVALALHAFERAAFACEVSVLRNGEQALECLLGKQREALPLPALILLDLHMPKVDGLQVLRRLRGAERTRLVPVVPLACANDDPALEECFALGCRSVVRKPLDPRAFAEVVTHLGMSWLTTQRKIRGGRT